MKGKKVERSERTESGSVATLLLTVAEYSEPLL
jgi:hypothetical protein